MLSQKSFKWKCKADIKYGNHFFPSVLQISRIFCFGELIPTTIQTSNTMDFRLLQDSHNSGAESLPTAEQTMLSPLRQGNNSLPHHAPPRCFDSHRSSPHSCSSFWEDLHNPHRGSWLAALSLKCPVLPYRRKLQSCSLKGAFPLTSMPTATFGALRPASACFLAALSLQLLLWSAAAFGEHPGALLSCTGKQQLLQLRQAYAPEEEAHSRWGMSKVLITD